MNSIEREWKKILKEIIKNGRVNKKDDSEVLEILGYHIFIKNPMLYPHFTYTPETFVNYVQEGYLDIEGYPMSGESISKYLLEFHDSKCIYPDRYDDSFVYTYPERLLAMKTFDKNHNEERYIDQLSVIANRLEENSGSNRAVATLYNCGLDKDETDIPCLNWIQATIRDDKLKLHVTFRSNDAYGAWPSNMFFITYIGIYLCNILKIEYPSLDFEGIDYHVSSLHIYKTDLNAVQKILE